MTVIARHFKLKAMILIFTVCTRVSAVELPTAEKINQLEELAKLSTETFFQQSFKSRMQYEFSDTFLTETDKNSLLEICQTAATDLKTIAQQQQQLKTQIEDYEGPDWEHRYGQTGLWRKLNADLYKTQLALHEIDYYLALTVKADEQKQIAATKLINLKQLEEQFSGDDLEFLKAKFIVLENTKPDSQNNAEEILNRIIGTALSKNSRSIQLWAMLEKAELKKDISALDKAVALARTQDFEGKNQWLITAAFLYHRLGDCQKFKQLLKKHRELATSAAKIILSQLEAGKEPMCCSEIELAAIATLQKESIGEQADILTSLAETNNFESPLLFYAAGLSLVQTSPKKACEFLIRASQFQKDRKSDYLNIDAPAIAEQASRLAYNLYSADSNQCEFAVRIFRNYRQISSDKMAEDLEYAYTQLLYECYDTLEGQYLLKRIAQANSKYSKKAVIQLAAQQLRTEGHQDPKQRLFLLQQFADSLEDAGDCRYTREVLGLAKDTLSKIETFEDNPQTHAAMLHNSYKIANFFLDCSFEPFDDLIWAELSILTADANNLNLIHAEEIIAQSISRCDTNRSDLLRCRARLLQKKARFCEAAKLWQKLAEIIKISTPESWQWWRAKYYELFCWLNCENAAAEDTLHAIDVLQVSFDIPAPWAEKLDALKQ
ncbi:MAG: hypothetical protein PVG93_01725 [Phycisphaerales bacterium]|jgi:hypothetical protein